MTAPCGTRPIKRRSRSEIGAIKQVIREVLAESHPATVRQTYYQLVARGAIAKTEIEYKRTEVRLLTAMRRSGDIPFGWKDALSGVLYNVTAEFDVPLMVTRGYPSISYLYEAGETIAETQKPAYLYYFGDYDPSGCDITRAVESGIREFAPEAEIHFERQAVTREQIEAWSLPSRPAKQSDSRSEGFAGDSVEVDSIPPAKLRELVRAAITRHIDPHQMAASRAIEEQERETLRRIIGNLGRAA